MDVDRGKRRSLVGSRRNEAMRSSTPHDASRAAEKTAQAGKATEQVRSNVRVKKGHHSVYINVPSETRKKHTLFSNRSALFGTEFAPPFDGD